MTATEYLRKPYARRLTPTDDGGYVATIQEFPGLVAEGETAEASVAALEAAARSWIEAALGSGQHIPEPVALTGYSGKVALRMPRGLHKRAAEMASSENVSLNQWLVSAVSHYLGGRETITLGLLPVLQSLRMSMIIKFQVTAVASTQTAPIKEVPAVAHFINADNFMAPALTGPALRLVGG